MMNKLRIVFMGTPDFAVGILDQMIKNQYEIVGVITAPDKPAGRGQKIQQSAVKTYAVSKNLHVLQPTNLKDPLFLEALASLKANLQVVVAFRMLPEVVWKMPALGTFNLHASLLPQYRGAAPINWAIINGEIKTGVTTFFIDDKIDTGAIIDQIETNISPNETAGELHNKLMNLGATLVIKTLEKIAHSKVNTCTQLENTTLKTAYKLHKENCKIDWQKPLNDIYNHIRGLNPYPAAWTVFEYHKDSWNVKIYETQQLLEKPNHPIGKIITSKNTMKIACADGYLQIDTLQFPGKKKMKTTEILNGFQFSDQAKTC
jgi:methionyl-tRNA formyltransferase